MCILANIERAYKTAKRTSKHQWNPSISADCPLKNCEERLLLIKTLATLVIENIQATSPLMKRKNIQQRYSRQVFQFNLADTAVFKALDDEMPTRCDVTEFIEKFLNKIGVENSVIVMQIVLLRRAIYMEENLLKPSTW
eukprot:CAMPEP_0114997222 /NCGR_PEP_ID=MMETSP0216-20121206/14775_1 /TAXON_ID=223996 /ORGANISM="Protocruzia adherens, Strain Boccale" /LENGTH=138 /DNA_ID=CAMNT_0002361571 /DNA_START=73 /DNA_END=486 /DNA_ORIENTATION=-